MQVEITLTKAEYQYFLDAIVSGAYDGESRQLNDGDFMPVVVLAVALITIMAGLLTQADWPIDITSIGLGIFVGGAIAFGIGLVQKKKALETADYLKDDCLFATSQHEFRQNELVITNEFGKFSHKRDKFGRVFMDESILLLFISPVRSVIYPLSQIGSERALQIESWVKGE